MAKKSSRRKVIKLRPIPTNCEFCKAKKVPDYKETNTLSKYMTDRAKIMPKSRTGLCSKHQRRIAIEIKRSRMIGLLPFTSSL
ncbi:MAG: 30S ribosomal protein S18 [Patescibacteria group bacterium]